VGICSLQAILFFFAQIILSRSVKIPFQFAYNRLGIPVIVKVQIHLCASGLDRFPAYGA